MRCLTTPIVSLFLFSFCIQSAGMADELKVMFLGDNGPHRPQARFSDLQPVMATRGIDLVYTESMSNISRENLANYDALLLYANIDQIDPSQEQAILSYVANGGGFVPLHCASYCFRNSVKMVELIGAQFRSHGTGVFRTEIARPNHELLAGFGGFESWDETYVHHKHNEHDRTVLEYRAFEQGREPWTWVRTHGNGRVFYTAWGHDHRTWKNPGFHNLVERGIRWAARADLGEVKPFMQQAVFPVPRMTPARKDLAPFEYVDVGAKIPNYLEGSKWGVQGEPKTKMQKPISPQKSIQHFVTPIGFQVELFASESELGGKPIAMSWDERGRLFVCESYDYPNELQPAGKGRDRIRICTDTDGDGRADQFTVFAENLSIPTALAPYRGGMIVQNGHETLYLKDTDGDDRADLRKVLISNWSIGDTHGGVSNFRYGLDNWIWGMQGYNNSEPMINGNKQQAFRMGFFRFRLDNHDPPQVTELEFIRSTNNNTWGLGISEEGLIFGSTANRNPSVFMPIPNRYYERVRGWTKSLQLGSIADSHLFQPITDNVRQVDHFGGYTAGAGHALYTARHYPLEYWNRTAFVAGPTGHLVGTFVLTPRGSGFSSTSPFNLLASDDEWTAPILAEVGPDGTVWVIDWYNYIVQHNPTPKGFETGKGNAFKSDLRDKTHGRIYRVVYDADSTALDTDAGDVAANPAKPKDAASKPSVATLSESTPPHQIVEHLRHPTMLVRLHAQRLLVERGKTDIALALLKLVGDTTTDEIGLNVGAIHALWTLQGLGQLDGSDSAAIRSVHEALRHPSAGVRRAAVNVLPQTAESVAAISETRLLNDHDAQVRLAAMLALADQPSGIHIANLIVTAMQDPTNIDDPWIPDAAMSAAAVHSETFLLTLCDISKPSARIIDMAMVIAEHYARGNRFDALPLLCDRIAAAPSNLAAAIIGGLERGWPKDSPLASADFVDTFMIQTLPRLPAADRGVLLNLARRWGSGAVDEQVAKVRQTLVSQLTDSAKSPREKIKIASQLISIDPKSAETVVAILDQITPQTPPKISVALLETLLASEYPRLAELITGEFQRLTPASRSASINVLLGRPKSTIGLLNAISGGKIELGELSASQRQRLTEHPNVMVRAATRVALSNSGDLPNPDRQRVIDDLSPLVLNSGDPMAGKAAFKKHCANCHAHSGEGGKIGPDLTGMAAHPKEELLIHILDPSRSVEGNFQTYTLLTLDGRVRSGMVASESQTTIELINPEGQRETLLREEIEQLVRSKKSLMPEGMEKQASPKEIRDLLEFLTIRGRFLPLDLSKFATISSGRGMFYDEHNEQERLLLDNWSTTTVQDVPFQLVDPQDGETANVIMLHSPNGDVSQRMPKSVAVPIRGTVKQIHLLSGVSGWGAQQAKPQEIAMFVRLQYADGATEDHPLRNGQHFADYIRRIDVPDSEFAFTFKGDQQMRYLTIEPRKNEPIKQIEFTKGRDRTSPIVMAVTLE